MKISQYQSFAASSPRIEQGKQGNFANSFSAALAEANKPAKDSSAASASSSAVAGRNVSSMTPAQMRSFAKEMLNEGKIDQEAFLSLTLVGPTGKVGPNGEFIPFTESEREVIDNTPVNYHQIASTFIARIESDGRQMDATSGYQKWKGIQEALNSY